MTSIRATVLLGATGLALLALSLVSVLQAARPWFQAATEGKTAAQVASEFVEAYGAFDYRNPTAYRERLSGLTGGPLHEALVSPAPDPAALGQQQVQQANVLDARVTSISERAATVTVNAEHTTTMAGVMRQQAQRQFVCTLARSLSDDGAPSGTWRVVAFRLVAERPLPSNESEVTQWNR